MSGNRILKFGAASVAAAAAVILAITSVGAHSSQATTRQSGSGSVVGNLVLVAGTPVLSQEQAGNMRLEVAEEKTEAAAKAAELAEKQAREAAESAAKKALEAAQQARQAAEEAAADSNEQAEAAAEAAEQSDDENGPKDDGGHSGDHQFDGTEQGDH